MAESGDPARTADATALSEENLRLAKRCLELEEASRRQIERLRAANDRLMHSESHLRRLLDEASLGFMLLNRDFVLESANTVLCRLLDYEIDELSGLDFRQFVYVGKLAAFTRLADRSPEGCCAHDDIDLIGKSGDTLPCRLSAAPWVDEEGKPRGAFFLVLDISSETSAEGRVRDMRLAVRESEKTRKMFLDIIDHEMRASASSIMGMIQLLRETRLDERQTELSGVIYSSANALQKLVGDLTEMAALETHNLKLRPAPFRLYDLCARVVGLFAQRAGEKGVNLQVDIGPAAPDVAVGDAGRLRQVLVHLVDNSLKFTDRGRVILAVDLIGEQLRFMVSDTGRGMDAETRREILDDPLRSAAPSERRHGGLGIGLSLCRRLVGLMGGTLGFESSAGRGSEFHFFIPLVRPAEEEGVGDEMPRIESALRLPPLDILAAESNPLGRKILKTFLQFDDHRLTLVDNGMEAAEKRQAGDYDVLLLDMQMPGLDGLQTIRIIRDWEEESGKKPIPAVALTAAALAEDDAFYTRAGLAGYVTKPFRPVELMSAIARAAGVEPLALAPEPAPAVYAAEASGGEVRRVDASQIMNLRQVMQNAQFVGLMRFFMEDAVPGIVGIGAMAERPDPDRDRIAFAAEKVQAFAGYLGFRSLSEQLGALSTATRGAASSEELRRQTRELSAVTDDSLEELKRIYPSVFATLTKAPAPEPRQPADATEKKT
ncbi:MAG: response regulator [Planctomycetota bacterium]|jgi:PAS domain S-box-containing protein|nr:response regulator [Planctomycetota bacterium]